MLAKLGNSTGIHEVGRSFGDFLRSRLFNYTLQPNDLATETSNDLVQTISGENGALR